MDLAPRRAGSVPEAAASNSIAVENRPAPISRRTLRHVGFRHVTGTQIAKSRSHVRRRALSCSARSPAGYCSHDRQAARLFRCDSSALFASHRVRSRSASVCVRQCQVNSIANSDADHDADERRRRQACGSIMRMSAERGDAHGRLCLVFNRRRRCAANRSIARTRGRRRKASFLRTAWPPASYRPGNHRQFRRARSALDDGSD